MFDIIPRLVGITVSDRFNDVDMLSVSEFQANPKAFGWGEPWLSVMSWTGIFSRRSGSMALSTLGLLLLNLQSLKPPFARVSHTD